MGIQTSISFPVWDIHNLKFLRKPCHFPDIWAYFPLSPNSVLYFIFLWIMRYSFYRPIQGRPHKIQSHHSVDIQ